MYKVYLYKLNSDVMLREESEIFGLLPRWRQDKAIRYKVDLARWQSIAAGRLLDIALSDYLGRTLRDEDWEDISYFDRFIDQRTGQVIYFSISHSGDYVVTAISDLRVGVDIETKSDKGYRITDRMFSESERRYVRDAELSETMRQAHFRDIWTTKESFLKCTGEGISVPLSSFSAELYAPIIVSHSAYEAEGCDDATSDRAGGGAAISDITRTEIAKDTSVRDSLVSHVGVSDSGVIWRIISCGYTFDSSQNNHEFYVAQTRIDGESASLSLCTMTSNIILDIKTVKVLV